MTASNIDWVRRLREEREEGVLAGWGRRGARTVAERG